MSLPWWVLFGFLLGPVLIVSGLSAWLGKSRSWTTVDANTPSTEGSGGFQLPSILLAMGLMGLSFAIMALPRIWWNLEGSPVIMAFAAPLFALAVVTGALGILVPFLALIWWPIHRIWGPRWYTMLSREQVKQMDDDGTDLLDIGGKHPRPKAGRHLAFWYGRQITPEAPRDFPKAAAGHLWASKMGVYFDPWQRALEGYRKRITWASMSDVRVIPAGQIIQDGKLVADPNLLNRLRGPKLVIEVAPAKRTADPEPTLYQFTLTYRGANNAKALIDAQRVIVDERNEKRRARAQKRALEEEQQQERTEPESDDTDPNQGDPVN